MATLTYNSVDFDTTLGGLPTFSREITVELDPQSMTAIKERHVITLEWNAVPAEGQTLAQDQVDIAAFWAAIEALPDDAELIYSDNAGNVSWAYNSPTSANNHVCAKGLKITRIGFPHQQANAVTHTPVRLVFEAEVFVCANDPIQGVASLSYTVQEEWDRSGIVSITYAGILCACSGLDPRDLLDTFIAGTLTPDARQRFTDSGQTPGNGFNPDRVGITEHDQVITCVSFRVDYSIAGVVPLDLAATSLRIQVNVRIDQNWVIITITGIYGFTGVYRGLGGATTGSGWIVPTIGWGTYGLSGAGAGTFDVVWNEAWRHKGIQPNDFLPPGAGTVVMETDPEGAVNTDSNEISVKKVYHCRWIHDGDILTIDGTLEIDAAEREASARVLMNDLAGTEHRPFVATAGWQETYITYNFTVRGLREYYELPEMLAEDRQNIWRVRTAPASFETKAPNQRMPGASIGGQLAEGLTISRISQRYLVRDPSAVPGKDSLSVVSIRKLRTFTGAKMVRSGSLSDPERPIHPEHT